MDGVLLNARLGDGSLTHVAFENGIVTAVEPAGNIVAGEAPFVDLQGWLVLGAMAEPHAHLDKALTADEVVNPAGDLNGAVEAWSKATDVWRPEAIAARAGAALEGLIVNGVTAVRTHVNCGGSAGNRAIEALVEVRSRFAGLIDLQLAALPYRPVTGSEGADNRRALEAAVSAGVDIVGGAPHLDLDPGKAMRYLVDVAREAGLPLDMHTDETLDPGANGLSDLARVVIDTEFPQPVTASHCVSLGMQSPAVQAEVAALVAEAGIGVVTLPQTNLYLQGRGRESATPRGLTAVRALQSAGVVVAGGTDNVQDAFNLVGRNDPLETAALLVMAAHQLPRAAYEMVSTAARTILGFPPTGPEVGSIADLVAIEAPTVRAAVAGAPRGRKVFRKGRLTAESSETRSIHR